MAGGIKVNFSATDAGFTSTVSKVKSSMNSMDDNVKKVSGSVRMSFATMAKAGAALAVGFGAIKVAMNDVRGTLDNFKEALDMGGELSDLSARTGETAGNLMLLRRAFDNSGAGADKVGPVVNKLQKYLTDAAAGMEQNVKTLDALGTSYDELKGKTPLEQMEILAAKLRGVEDPTLRAGVAMRIFGRSGGEVLPLLNSFSQEIGTARDQLGSLPGVMDRANSTFDAISDNLTVIKGKATEAAAGFLEKLAPALKYFSDQLAGSDAAGWGNRMMQSIMRVADVLVGAFKAPDEAIKAIGASLSFAARESGNELLNGFITAGRFISEVFSSDIFSLAGQALSSGLQKAYVDSQKVLVDGLNNTIKFFTADFGAAFQSVVDFVASAFKNIAKFFASDLFNAITNPLDFITGKLGSAFADSAKKGGLTFKSAFSEGITTSLDKLSTGFEISSKDYGKKLGDSVSGLKDEFGKVLDNVDISDKDFFGAEKAKGDIKEAFNSMEEVGKKFREGVESKFLPVEDAKNDSAVIADNFNLAAMSMDDAAKSVEKMKTLSQQLREDLQKAKEKEEVDKGGKNEDRARNAMKDGQFDKSDRAIKKIEEGEAEKRIQGEFNKGGGNIKKSLQEIAKEQGIDTKGKNRSDLRKELDDLAKKRQEEMKPGKQGKNKDDAAPGNKAADPMVKISQAVEEIKRLVAKIEPKLPTVALGA